MTSKPKKLIRTTRFSSFHSLNYNWLLGDHCETCSDGWYGNATHGTPEDCSPCPCPGGPYASNQFASTCFLDSDGLPTCVGCSLGYENRFCNVCSDGYFGRPWVSLNVIGTLITKRQFFCCVVSPIFKMMDFTKKDQ